MYLEVLCEFLWLVGWLVGTEKLLQDFLCER